MTHVLVSPRVINSCHSPGYFVPLSGDLSTFLVTLSAHLNVVFLSCYLSTSSLLLADFSLLIV